MNKPSDIGLAEKLTKWPSLLGYLGSFPVCLWLLIQPPNGNGLVLGIVIAMWLAYSLAQGAYALKLGMEDRRFMRGYEDEIMNDVEVRLMKESIVRNRAETICGTGIAAITVIYLVLYGQALFGIGLGILWLCSTIQTIARERRIGRQQRGV